jgi:2-amino-4-hydroxy-6-hydroxymethyldihydropteridine diphosphokinase
MKVVACARQRLRHDRGRCGPPRLHRECAVLRDRGFLGARLRRRFDDVQARLLRLIGDPEPATARIRCGCCARCGWRRSSDFSIEPATAAPIRGSRRCWPRPRRRACSRRPSSCSCPGTRWPASSNWKRTACCRAAAGNRGRRWHPTAVRRVAPDAGAGPARHRRARGRRRAGVAGLPVRRAAVAGLLPRTGLLQAQGVHAAEAQRRAADRVTLHQVGRIALPRRFSLPMQEIWLLQSRFSQRQRKRVFRLLAHPRFRAAFDFLVLRLAASDSHAEDVAFWREAQHPGAAIARAGRTRRRCGRVRRRRCRRRGRCAAQASPSAPAPTRRRCLAGRARMTVAASGLGANLGDAARRCAMPSRRSQRCRHAPAARLAPLSHAGLGRDRPAGFRQRRRLVDTTLPARDLLDVLLAIERDAGRVRIEGERWGPRTLDLDLLLYGDAVIDEPGLRCRIRTCTNARSPAAAGRGLRRTQAFPASGPRVSCAGVMAADGIEPLP